MGEIQHGRRTKKELFEAGRIQRDKGDGALYQTVVHGKTVWRAARIITTFDGSRVKVQATGPTAQLARERLETNVAKRKSGASKAHAGGALASQAKSGRTPTFLDVAEEWLDTRSSDPGDSSPGKKKLRDSTLKSYDHILENHLDKWGLRPINSYSTDELRQFFYKDLPRKGNIGNSHLRAIQGLIRQVFAYAVEWKYLKKSPARNLRLSPRATNAHNSKVKAEGLERKTWVPDRIMSYLDPTQSEADIVKKYGASDPNAWRTFQELSVYEARWGLAAILGLRPSEALGLTWSRVLYLDDQSGVPARHPRIEIDQQLARERGPGRHGTKLLLSPNPKTPSGVRALPLTPELVEMLKRWKKIQSKWRRDKANWKPYPHLQNLVFTTKTGKPLKQQTDSLNWKKLLGAVFPDNTDEHAELRSLRAYSLRHLAITRLLKAGTPLAIVSAIAGHSSVSLTASVYGHLSLEDKIAPLEALSLKTVRERKIRDERDDAGTDD